MPSVHAPFPVNKTCPLHLSSKPEQQRVRGVFYGPHSSHEHMWIRNEDDLKEILGKDERPRVYVSNGKHASYPVSGRGESSYTCNVRVEFAFGSAEHPAKALRQGRASFVV